MSLVNDYEIKISIIVPVYNIKDKIERCLNSLNNQTYKNIEVLMINDGSTDGSERVCERFAETDTRFILINKPNGGVSTARNMGIKQAVGKYVMFVDSDDYVEVTACENMLNAIESSDSDLVIASFYSVKNNQIKEHICRYRVCYGVDEIADDFEYIYRECFINSPWNKLYKRELIKDFFKEDMRYFEDYYFNLDYMENIRSFVMTDKPVEKIYLMCFL